MQQDDENQRYFSCTERPNKENTETLDKQREPGHEMEGATPIEDKIGYHGTSEKIFGVYDLDQRIDGKEGRW